MEANNQQNNQNTQEDVGRLRQVRRDKLSELQAEGRDPFQIVKYDQTHHTKDIRDNFEALEFVVDEKTLHTGEALKNIRLKKNVLIACIMHKGSIDIPTGDSFFTIVCTVLSISLQILK